MICRGKKKDKKYIKFKGLRTASYSKNALSDTYGAYIFLFRDGFFSYKKQIVLLFSIHENGGRSLVPPQKNFMMLLVCCLHSRIALSLLGTILIGHVSDYYQC